MKKGGNIIIVGLTIGLGLLFYGLFFNRPVRQIFCRKQVDFKLYRFNLAVKKNGADNKIEDNGQIKKFLSDKYYECLK